MARPTCAKASLASPTRPSSETTSTPVNRALWEASELWQGFGSAGAALRRRSEASLPPEPPSPAEPRPFSPSWAPCHPLRRGRRVEGVPRLCQTQLRPLSHAVLARELPLPAEVEGADREAGGIGDGGLGTDRSAQVGRDLEEPEAQQHPAAVPVLRRQLLDLEAQMAELRRLFSRLEGS